MVLQSSSSIHVIRYYLQQKENQKQDISHLELVFHPFCISLSPISLAAPLTFCRCVRAATPLNTALLLHAGRSFLSLVE